MKELRKTIVEQRADIGIALDGDGDRVVLLDEKANILTADRLLSLFAQMCLEQQPDKEIVFDVKCSLMVQRTVERLGGKPKMIRTGSSFLRSYLSKSKGSAILVANMLATMCLMTDVVLGMTMVYMLHCV